MMASEQTPSPTPRCGYVAIIGRPNVGKSTLLNRILGQKVTITSRRPQTTRHCVLGIKTVAQIQAIYVDTPGMHQGAQHAMNRYMNRIAQATLHDVDVVVFVLEGTRWTDEDRDIAQRLQEIKRPLIVVLNKIDRLANKAVLLPHLQQLREQWGYEHLLPLCAKNGQGVELLEALVSDALPYAPHHFPEDQITDRSERFLAAELIREKLFRHLGQEVPYALTVEIEAFEDLPKLSRIHAIIWVERPGQKAIVIGEGGELLKAVGTQARLDMERSFERKVFLKLWVKVKEGWCANEQGLQGLGYEG